MQRSQSRKLTGNKSKDQSMINIRPSDLQILRTKNTNNNNNKEYSLKGASRQKQKPRQVSRKASQPLLLSVGHSPSSPYPTPLLKSSQHKYSQPNIHSVSRSPSNSKSKQQQQPQQQRYHQPSSLVASKQNSPNHKQSKATATATTKYFTASRTPVHHKESPASPSRQMRFSCNNVGAGEFSGNSSPSMTPTNSLIYAKEIVHRDLGRESFRFMQKIGSGGFGQVWRVEFKKNSRSYAMKQISKVKVIVKKSVQSILNQKQILANLYNSYIVNMKAAFQDRENLYLVLDYLNGGDLRYHLCSRDHFTEREAKFIIANVILGLEYIHDNRIIHRDIKPENLIFENNGYLRITDFGIARKYKEKNAHETSGTPGYMSPEVICKLNHSYESDYFAVGVIAYEFMLGKRPYVGGSRKQNRDHILSKQVIISRYEIPQGWSSAAADFVNRLLQRKKEARLGYNGIAELKNHPWLNSINWEQLKNKEVAAPFVPRNVCETTQYLREMELSEGSTGTDYEEQLILLRSQEIQDLFQNYNDMGAFKMYFGKESSTKSTFFTHGHYEELAK